MTKMEKAIHKAIKEIPPEHLESFLKFTEGFIQKAKSEKKSNLFDLFSDNTQLLDEIVNEAMQDREKQRIKSE